MEEIVSKFGVVVCSRSGTDIDKFIYDSDLLTKHKVSSLVGHALPHFGHSSGRSGIRPFLANSAKSAVAKILAIFNHWSSRHTGQLFATESNKTGFSLSSFEWFDSFMHSEW